MLTGGMCRYEADFIDMVLIRQKTLFPDVVFSIVDN